MEENSSTILPRVFHLQKWRRFSGNKIVRLV